MYETRISKILRENLPTSSLPCPSWFFWVGIALKYCLHRRRCWFLSAPPPPSRVTPDRNGIRNGLKRNPLLRDDFLIEINVGALSVCSVVTWLWRCVWSTRSTPPTEYCTLNYTMHKCRSRCLRESQLWQIKTSEWRNHFILDILFKRPALRNKVSFLLNTVRYSEIIIRHTKKQTEVYFFHIISKLDQKCRRNVRCIFKPRCFPKSFTE